MFKQRVSELGVSSLLPESIFGLGIVDQPPILSKRPLLPRKTKRSLIPRKTKRPLLPRKTKRSLLSRVKCVVEDIPKHRYMNIDYENLEIGHNLPLNNAVEVDPALLEEVALATENKTNNLSMLMLKHTAPSIVAHSAATTYVSAVMRDGFNIEFEEDSSVAELVKEVSTLEVLWFFINDLKVPQPFKDKMYEVLIDKLLTKASDASSKKAHAENMVRSVEAVLTRRSGNLPAERSNSKEPSERITRDPNNRTAFE